MIVANSDGWSSASSPTSASKRPIRTLPFLTLSPRASLRNSLRTLMRRVSMGRIKVIPEIAETLGGGERV
jgi:hypothetical protein